MRVIGCRREPRFFFAGQMTGGGRICGICGVRIGCRGKCGAECETYEPYIFPRETMIGAMATYVSAGGLGTFQPMNANFGIVPPLVERVRGGKKARNDALAARALEEIDRAAAILKIVR